MDHKDIIEFPGYNYLKSLNRPFILLVESKYEPNTEIQKENLHRQRFIFPRATPHLMGCYPGKQFYCFYQGLWSDFYGIGDVSCFYGLSFDSSLTENQYITCIDNMREYDKKHELVPTHIIFV